MDREKHIEREVEKTIACFHHMEHIEPDPYFLTRLEAAVERMEAHPQQPALSEIRRHYLQPALLLMLLFANIVTTAIIIKNEKSDSSIRSESLSSLAEEITSGTEDFSLFTPGK